MTTHKSISSAYYTANNLLERLYTGTAKIHLRTMKINISFNFFREIVKNHGLSSVPIYLKLIIKSCNKLENAGMS